MPSDKAKKEESPFTSVQTPALPIKQVSKVRLPIQTAKLNWLPIPPDLWPKVPLPGSLLPQPQGIQELAGRPAPSLAVPPPDRLKKRPTGRWRPTTTRRPERRRSAGARVERRGLAARAGRS